MKNKKAICFACKELHVLTKEHIIPQSIGGRLKEKLFCKTCNSSFGSQLDAEVSKQYSSFSNILNINGKRGKRQPAEVEDVNSGVKLHFDGKSYKRRDPKVDIKFKSDDCSKIDYVDIYARSEKELEEITTSIRKKHVLTGDIKRLTEHHDRTDVKHETELDNALLRRAVSKIAYGFLCTKLPSNTVLSSSFDAIRNYIKTGCKPHLAHANFINTQFMTDYIRPLHKIYVSLNRHEELVVGYVSLFGTFRFTVLLAEGFKSSFDWPDFDYTFDPVRREKVAILSNFRDKELRKEDVLKPKQSKEFLEREINKAFKVLIPYNNKIEYLKGKIC